MLNKVKGMLYNEAGMPYTVKGMSYNEICMPYDVVKAVNNEKKK